MSNVERLVEAVAGAFDADEIEMSADVVERMIDALLPIAADDVVMVMQGPDDAFVAQYQGPEGIRDGWSDWLGAFERLRFELEELTEVGENVLMLGKQIGVTRHGGVEIEDPSAVVWKFRDGLLTRVEFHLDPEKAAASAAETA
jgi:ketosteroid isomerase-like protein